LRLELTDDDKPIAYCAACFERELARRKRSDSRARATIMAEV
jgi:hypothetical protein